MPSSEQEEHTFHLRVIEELATLRKVSDNILIQTTKTNGRVSKLEERAGAHDILHALDANNKSKWDWWKDKIGTAFIGILCAAVGFTVLLVLQKTDIVDVSVVTAERYDDINSKLGD